MLAAGLSIPLTPTLVVLDEYFIDWAGWLPGWPSLISNGVIPLAFLLLTLVGLDEWFKTSFKANLEERILAMFVFVLVALLILTIIGIFFRAAGMSLVWPWEILAH